MKKVTWYQDLYNEIEDEPDFKAMKAVEDIIFDFCDRMNQIGMSQRDLAAKLGMSQPYVSKVLNRGQNISFKTLYIFAEALGMTVRPPKLFVAEDMKRRRKDTALELIKNTLGDYQELSGDFTGSEEICDDECINAAC